jgi:membrane-associated protease RseP (regulator of RpoE activity)
MLSMMGFLWLALSLAAGCKKTGDEGKGPAPKTPPASPAGAGQPAFDRAAAEKALIDHVWQGVLGGKPMKLFVIPMKGKLAGVLRLGKKEIVGRLTLDAKGSILLTSQARPTPQGLETTTFGGKVKPDLSGISGSAERVAKQGFVEQAFGLGDWSLAKGPPLEGAPIFHVATGSLTAALGIKPGDILVELGGKKVRNGAIPELSGAPGSAVTAAVLRDGKQVALKGKMPPKAAPASGPARKGTPDKAPADKAEE